VVVEDAVVEVTVVLQSYCGCWRFTCWRITVVLQLYCSCIASVLWLYCSCEGLKTQL
jgi:hypothetical protein